MSNQPFAHDHENTVPHPALLQALSELDDDGDDAEWNLDDDEDLGGLRQTGWIARAGFGSPEWWSR